tara:strand:+ start:47180 stop:48046 length:867 start_codon:yes stop_codon:yes gene_type:complete
LLRHIALSVFLLVHLLLSCAVSAQPKVSASIKPLQLIAAAITDGISEPWLIIGAGQDPHHPALRPSERQKLANADILLWVGTNLESAFTDLIADMDEGSSSVITAYELIAAAGLSIANSNDPHIWLSTDNTRLIAQALTLQLVELDSANRAGYEANLTEFLSAMDKLDREIAAQLAAFSSKAFAVYHNAFTYYERQFGLQHVASFTQNEEVQPGIRKVLEIRQSMLANDVSCLLLEPGNNPLQIRQLTGMDMKMVSIDVLGFAYPLSKSGYVDFMQGLTGSITSCLEP